MEPLLPFALSIPRRPTGQRQRALYQQLRDAIVSGRLAAGLKLPSSRSLAKGLRLSRNTVLGAYDRLLAEGYIESRHGSGSFIASAARAAPVHIARSRGDLAEAFELARWRSLGINARERSAPSSAHTAFLLGVPDWRAFPRATWKRLLAKALMTQAGLRPDYAAPAGPLRLRRAIASHISRSRAVACDANELIVTSGAQQAFDLLARVLVTRPATAVAVEDPGYPALRAAFRAAGAQLLPCPVDEAGMVIPALSRRARIICVTPSHQFPLGVAMSFARRQMLLEFASKVGAVIIEDDYDSEFRFDGRPLDALKTLDRDERVVYVGTFSKCMYPGLRVGYIAAPAWLREALIAAKRCVDPLVPTVTAEALADFIEEGHLARHIRRMTGVYERRRNAVLAAMRQRFEGILTPLPSAAGLHVSAWAGPRVRIAEWLAAAQRRGVLVRELSDFSETRPCKSGLAFGYGMLEEAEIEQGMRVLASALRPSAGP